MLKKLEFDELFANVIGSPWGELSPVRRLRGACILYSYESVMLHETPLRHRCAMPPLPKERLIRKTPSNFNLFLMTFVEK